MNPTDVDPVEAVRDATGGRGADIGFETTGVPQVLTTAVRRGTRWAPAPTSARLRPA
ncbi:hypothetical protein [Blastococcus montanus]|uniref:hypothetical protein n=1 Tax=Blastococcus montanus TaxID=3144973 RepID=UPI003207E572